MAMYQVILCAATALLVAIAVQPATADDSKCYDRSDEGITACSRLLAADPTNSYAYIMRGNHYKRKGDYDRAISDYDQALQLDPKITFAWVKISTAYMFVPLAYVGRGDAYRGKGDFDRAISDYDQALQLDPKDARAYSGRGDAYEAKNDTDHAIADFDQALKLDPLLVDAQSGRERVLLTKRSSPGAQTNMPAR
jgi:tetratricopeptide (TPR) repeat protein